MGAQRTDAWAKYLHESGYYPIIITRQWNDEQTDIVNKVVQNELSVEKKETHEVHRLPYRRSLRDKCSDIFWLKPLQKLLTLKELVLSNYFLSALPYDNFYRYAKKLLHEDDSISILIASGRPFHSFHIGHVLKKEFPSIHWIPDYRDEWTTRSTNNIQPFVNKKILALESRKEKKWTSNASFFISVSEHWIENISKLIGKPGKLVLNGYNTYDKLKTSEVNVDTKSSELKVLYVGSIYDYQDFSMVLEAAKRLNTEADIQIYFTFLGSYANEAERKSLEESMKGFNDFVQIKPKVKQLEVADHIEQSDVLFLTEYKNLKGCLPVKIFDYYNSEHPILLCPSDKDLMEEFIEKTQSGYIANSIEESKSILHRMISLKKAGKKLIGPRNIQNAYFYSREFQTKQLAKYLDELAD